MARRRAHPHTSKLACNIWEKHYIKLDTISWLRGVLEGTRQTFIERNDLERVSKEQTTLMKALRRLNTPKTHALFSPTHMMYTHLNSCTPYLHGQNRFNKLSNVVIFVFFVGDDCSQEQLSPFYRKTLLAWHMISCNWHTWHVRIHDHVPCEICPMM